MQKLVVFVAFIACAVAAPGVLLAHHTPVVAAVHAPVLHATVPVVGSKTTITKSSQVVNHGSQVVHAVHTPVVSVPVVKTVHAPVVAVHSAPVVHSVHAVHAAPVVHSVHAVHAAPIVHSVHAAPVVIKTAPSAVAHSSSIVHHASVKALPVLAIH